VQAEAARIMTGREPAVYQTADAFALFTGLAPSVEIMGNASQRKKYKSKN
jgi:shikimate dehydrogenase